MVNGNVTKDRNDKGANRDGIYDDDDSDDDDDDDDDVLCYDRLIRVQ